MRLRPPAKTSKTYERLTQKRLLVRAKKKIIPKGTLKKASSKFFQLFLILLILGVVGIAIGGTYKYYSKTDIFLLKGVVIEGNYQLAEQDVMDYLNIELGVKLSDVPTEDYQEKLEKHPWIQSVKVSRRYPSRIKVRIKEEKPVALYRLQKKGGSVWYGFSEQGAPLPDVSLQKNNLPVLEGLAGADSLELVRLAQLLKVSKEKYPNIYNSLSQIKYRGKNEFVLFSRDNQFEYLISVDREPEAMLHFWDLLVWKQGAKFKRGQIIDLRVEGYAYVS